MVLYKKLTAYCESIDFQSILVDRTQQLEPLVQYIAGSLKAKKFVNIVFVCTHNSRRSQLAQVLLGVAATYAGVSGVRTYSSGTESTAVYPSIIKTLNQVGVSIAGSESDPTGNPIYFTRWKSAMHPVRLFSKSIHEASHNPRKQFAAVMVCSDADENCPFVPGTDKRISLPYEDPKISDGSPLEEHTYAARRDQILTEMLWVAHQVALQLK